jgi:hypothetical protein
MSSNIWIISVNEGDYQRRQKDKATNEVWRRALLLPTPALKI